MTRANDVLAFWFDPSHRACWFAKNAAFDAEIRTRFAIDTQAAADGAYDLWSTSPRGWLGLLILLDQFPRNLYRDDPRAWQQDLRAQQLALSGIAEKFDRQLPVEQRAFAYMPFEHAEDLSLQRRSVALFEQLARDAYAEGDTSMADFLEYARVHCEVVTRFGRFPHRNAVLGRASTPAEVDYLQQPGSRF